MAISRKKLDKLKASAQERKEKSTDMDTLISSIMTLPYGQLKKVRTDDVMAVLEKYGYTE